MVEAVEAADMEADSVVDAAEDVVSYFSMISPVPSADGTNEGGRW